ncbi:MAG: TIGR00282 family metallophosphoesterase [Deltaproteobacteria bacterium]|nr:TIGR00282 family metallophosphoesterase [Deltaproteobacteria bacterium]
MSKASFNILLLGDVVGRAGRMALRNALDGLIRRYRAGFVVANGENAASGMGITPEIAIELFNAGVDVITSGNHIWCQRQIIPFLDDEPRLLRPVNYPGQVPGRGSGLFTAADGRQVGVINLEGRVFMNNLDCPFLAADRELAVLREQTPLLLVDFHAETTSEKGALGYYLDGRVSVVAGTHTHVQTADARILSGGTAYISDLGMTGSLDGVIGFRKEQVIQRFLTQRPVRLEPAKRMPVVNGLAVELDPETGRALKVERIFERVAGDADGEREE